MTEDKTRKALVQSIEKWKDNFRQVDPSTVSLGANTCPLCQIFLDFEKGPGEYCGDCPINRQNKNMSCSYTPYSTAHQAWLDWYILANGSQGPASKVAQAGKLNWQNKAANMIGFLEKTLENYDNGQNT